MIDFTWNVREKQELIMARDKVGRWSFSLTVMRRLFKEEAWGQKV